MCSENTPLPFRQGVSLEAVVDKFGGHNEDDDTDDGDNSSSDDDDDDGWTAAAVTKTRAPGATVAAVAERKNTTKV